MARPSGVLEFNFPFPCPFPFPPRFPLVRGSEGASSFPLLRLERDLNLNGGPSGCAGWERPAAAFIAAGVKKYRSLTCESAIAASRAATKSLPSFMDFTILFLT